MNAVVALCHFCEVHGPSVVMCTQPFRRPEESDEAGCAGVGSDELDCTERSDVTVAASPAPSASVSKAAPAAAAAVAAAPPAPAGAQGGPQHYIPNEKVYDDEQVTDKSKEKSKCNACSSIPPDLTAFVSNDHAARTSYVSSQCAKDSKLFVMMRQACLRSLSCEMYPRQEGPIYFGDDKRGHVLSYFFFLKDNKARGLQVRYSIILVTLDKLYLLNSWSFLVRSIRQISKRLESAADKVFEMERRFSQPSRRNPPPKHLPSLRITSVNNIRSLVELTNDQQIFQRCHIWFTWLLRAGGSQWKELLLEGPPIEDHATLFEFYEGVDDEVVDAVQTLEDPPADLVDDGRKEGAVAAAGAPDADEGPQFDSLRQVFQLIGAERFEIVAFHVVTGNQLVIRSVLQGTVRSMLLCLAKLLPQKCVSCNPSSAAYLEEYKCNFLGLKAEAVVPGTALNRSVLIDISPPPGATMDQQVKLNQLEFRLSTNVRDYNDKPKFLKQVLSLVQTDPNQVCESALERALLAFREDWIHKARLFFSFNRCERPRLDDREVETRYRGLVAALQMTRADEGLVRFWMSGLSEHFKRQVSHGASFRS